MAIGIYNLWIYTYLSVQHLTIKFFAWADPRDKVYFEVARVLYKMQKIKYSYANDWCEISKQ